MSNLYRGPFTDAFYQILIHLAKWLQRRRFFQKSTNQKQELSVAAMSDNGSGRKEQSLQRTCHRCFLPSFGSFGQVVSEKIFFNQPIRNKNCLWWPCLLMNRNKMGNLYIGPSNDASYQVSVHLAKRLQRRRFFQKLTNQKQELSVSSRRRLKCEKLPDDRRRTPSDGKSSHCLWQGELKKKDTANI